MTSTVALVATRPETVADDYRRLLELVGWREALPAEAPVTVGLQLDWSRYFPACGAQPWQLESVLRVLLAGGMSSDGLRAVAACGPRGDGRACHQGAHNYRWREVLADLAVPFAALPEEEWVVHRPRVRLHRLESSFPEGIMVPRRSLGSSSLVLATGRGSALAPTGGALPASLWLTLRRFPAALRRHAAETVAEVIALRREVHPHQLAVVDASVLGYGSGRRAIRPVAGHVLLASCDPVALDAVTARLMGYDPLQVPHLRLCDERRLGVARSAAITLVGEEDLLHHDLGFATGATGIGGADGPRNTVGPGYPGAARRLGQAALGTPLAAPVARAADLYHDLLWYPLIGRRRLAHFWTTPWGRLFGQYAAEQGGTTPLQSSRAIPKTPDSANPANPTSPENPQNRQNREDFRNTGDTSQRSEARP